MRHIHGSFDLLVDYGTLDDLPNRDRDAYARNARRLTRPGKLLLWCFEWELSRAERLLTAMLPFGQLAMRPGEIDQRFGDDFDIRRIGGEKNLRGWPRGWAAYLMTRANAA